MSLPSTLRSALVSDGQHVDTDHDVDYVQTAAEENADEKGEDVQVSDKPQRETDISAMTPVDDEFTPGDASPATSTPIPLTLMTSLPVAAAECCSTPPSSDSPSGHVTGNGNGSTPPPPPPSKLQPQQLAGRTVEEMFTEWMTRGGVLLQQRPPSAQLQQLRKRRASGDSHDSSTKTAADAASIDTKDDDDDNEDEDEDDAKLQSFGVDPDRLKAFNLFVRLFVDENLDRMVPISKQPKDKVQAILEACDRQFGEFHDRARKRIRTYLKSCRRMRRCKDLAGSEPLRPTPPHLTSAIAESILAQACENESINAKRMCMGLEPLPANSVAVGTPGAGSLFVSTSSLTATVGRPIVLTSDLPVQFASTPVTRADRFSPLAFAASGLQGCDVGFPVRQQRHLSSSSPMPTSFDMQSSLFGLASSSVNGSYPGLFVAAAAAHQRHAARGGAMSTPLGFSTTENVKTGVRSIPTQNGPTDLSVKKSTLSGSRNQLNAIEVATVRQLIAGYRESAAFLYRSADELEQLLHHQH